MGNVNEKYEDKKPSKPVISLTQENQARALSGGAEKPVPAAAGAGAGGSTGSTNPSSSSPSRKGGTSSQDSGGGGDPLSPANLGKVSGEITLTWKRPKGLKKSSVYGYRIEMWDLSNHSWLLVTQTPNSNTTCVLSNILSGMLYQFRVTALTSYGDSEPSEPSDGFIVDIPEVNIAPYWLTTLSPDGVECCVHDNLTLKVEALGTPRPTVIFYKDDDEIFVTEGVNIEATTEFATELRVFNLQPEDSGRIEAIAINKMGKAICETQLTLRAKPEFRTHSVFQAFKECELIRIKLPLMADPEPDLCFYRDLDDSSDDDEDDSTTEGEFSPTSRALGSIVKVVSPPMIDNLETLENLENLDKLELEEKLEKPKVEPNENSQSEPTSANGKPNSYASATQSGVKPGLFSRIVPINNKKQDAKDVTSPGVSFGIESLVKQSVNTAQNVFEKLEDDADNPVTEDGIKKQSLINRKQSGNDNVTLKYQAASNFGDIAEITSTATSNAEDDDTSLPDRGWRSALGSSPGFREIGGTVTFLITSAQPCHAGDYTIIARNRFGEDKATVSLRLSRPPRRPPRPKVILDSKNQNEVHLHWRTQQNSEKRKKQQRKKRKKRLEQQSQSNIDFKGGKPYSSDNNNKHKSVISELDKDTSIQQLALEDQFSDSDFSEVEEENFDGVDDEDIVIDYYEVEYYRDLWKLWLKAKKVPAKRSEGGRIGCALRDLIPGSYYRFRVRAHAPQFGYSEPSSESEPVFVGAPVEDEVFGLPGGNYPKDYGAKNTSKLGYGKSSLGGFDLKKNKSLQNFLSGVRASHQSRKRNRTPEKQTKNSSSNATTSEYSEGSNESAQTLTPGSLQSVPKSGGLLAKPPPAAANRTASLEREVYYSPMDGMRHEGINYRAVSAEPGLDFYGSNSRFCDSKNSLGKKVFSKYRLSTLEERIYRDSLSNLCGAILRTSQKSIPRGGYTDDEEDGRMSRRSQEQNSPKLTSQRGRRRLGEIRQTHSVDNPAPVIPTGSLQLPTNAYQAEKRQRQHNNNYQNNNNHSNHHHQNGDGTYSLGRTQSASSSVIPSSARYKSYQEFFKTSNNNNNNASNYPSRPPRRRQTQSMTALQASQSLSEIASNIGSLQSLLKTDLFSEDLDFPRRPERNGKANKKEKTPSIVSSSTAGDRDEKTNNSVTSFTTATEESKDPGSVSDIGILDDGYLETEL